MSIKSEFYIRSCICSLFLWTTFIDFIYGCQVHHTGNDAEVHWFVHVCYSEYSMYFGWTLYVIEGALLTFSAFLAWESRHVS